MNFVKPKTVREYLEPILERNGIKFAYTDKDDTFIGFKKRIVSSIFFQNIDGGDLRINLADGVTQQKMKFDPEYKPFCWEGEEGLVLESNEGDYFQTYMPEEAKEKIKEFVKFLKMYLNCYYEEYADWNAEQGQSLEEQEIEKKEVMKAIDKFEAEAIEELDKIEK